MKAKGEQTINLPWHGVPNSIGFSPYSTLIRHILFNWKMLGKDDRLH